MKYVLVIFLLPYLSFSQYENTYLNGNKKMVFDTVNLMIDGDFVYYYQNGNTKTKGKFKKNQKIGLWKYYLPNGKLFFKRNYKSNYEFIQDKNNETLANYGKENNYQYWFVNHYSIYEEQDFTTLIKPNSLNNHGFFNQNTLINEIKKYIKNSERPEVYRDEKFEEIYDKDSLKSLLNNIKDIDCYIFKEFIFYDVQYQIMNRRVISIAPTQINDDKYLKPLFYIYEPEFRKHLSNDLILEKTFYNNYYGEVIEIRKKSFYNSPYEHFYAKKEISWYDVKNPFDFEAFFLEKEINWNIRMQFESERFINTSDSLLIQKVKRTKPKYELIK